MIVGLSACKSIEPIVPETVVQDIPRLYQNESSISLPIKINLQPYLTLTEKSLPKTFYGKEENCEGVSYSFKYMRDPIKFEGKGDQLSYEVDGKYLLNLNYCPECTSIFNEKGNCIVPRIYASCGVGEPMRRVTVAFSTKFKISPDFKFKTITSLSKFETIDDCEITVFNYNATDQLRKEVVAVLNDLEKDIDKQIASIDIRKEVEEVWKTISTPTSLGKYGFFSAHPKAVSLSDIYFDKKEAFVNLNLSFQPVITTNPTIEEAPKLPNLSTYKTSKGFNINLDIVATYDSLSSILSSELKGKTVMIKKNEVIFNSVEIQGASNKQLTLKVDFGGKRNGTLFLVGTPMFDSVQQKIEFPDLHFDLQTKNALLKSAKWMFNSKITDMLRENASFDLHPHLNEIKKTIQKEMNRELTEGIRITGKVESISLNSIFPNHQNLIIRVNTTGDMKLAM